MRFIVFIFFGILFALSRPAHSDDARLAKLKIQIGKNFEGRNGGRVAEKLRSQGLSREDSESISEEMYTRFGSCLVDSMLSQAIEESVPVEEILSALEEKVFDNSTYRYGDVLDWASVERRVEPCVMAIMAEAGMSINVPPNKSLE